MLTHTHTLSLTQLPWTQKWGLFAISLLLLLLMFKQSQYLAKCIQWPVKQRVEFYVLLLPSFREAVISLTAHMQQWHSHRVFERIVSKLHIVTCNCTKKIHQMLLQKCPVFVCVSLLLNPQNNLQSTASVQERPLLVCVAERPEPDSKTQLSQQCGPLRQLQPFQTMVTWSPTCLSKGFASLIFML